MLLLKPWHCYFQCPLSTISNAALHANLRVANSRVTLRLPPEYEDRVANPNGSTHFATNKTLFLSAHGFLFGFTVANLRATFRLPPKHRIRVANPNGSTHFATNKTLFLLAHGFQLGFTVAISRATFRLPPKHKNRVANPNGSTQFATNKTPILSVHGFQLGFTVANSRATLRLPPEHKIWVAKLDGSIYFATNHRISLLVHSLQPDLNLPIIIRKRPLSHAKRASIFAYYYIKAYCYLRTKFCICIYLSLFCSSLFLVNSKYNTNGTSYGNNNKSGNANPQPHRTFFRSCISGFFSGIKRCCSIQQLCAFILHFLIIGNSCINCSCESVQCWFLAGCI